MLTWTQNFSSQHIISNKLNLLARIQQVRFIDFVVVVSQRKLKFELLYVLIYKENLSMTEISTRR